jgi:hypothetical protein
MPRKDGAPTLQGIQDRLDDVVKKLQPANN